MAPKNGGIEWGLMGIALCYFGGSLIQSLILSFFLVSLWVPYGAGKGRCREEVV